MAGVISDVATAAESQRRAVDDFGEDVVTLRAAVDRIADLHEDAASAAAEHTARLDAVAATASQASRQAADAGSALEAGSRTLASALGRLDTILDTATDGVTTIAETIAEQHDAQDELVAGMQDATRRLGGIGRSASALEVAVNGVASVIVSLEAAMSSVGASVPSSMLDAANGLRATSRGSRAPLPLTTTWFRTCAPRRHRSRSHSRRFERTSLAFTTCSHTSAGPWSPSERNVPVVDGIGSP